jgi:cadherin EGF LAG seven-pass G-type receptor 1
MNSNTVPVIQPSFSSSCELKSRSFSKNSFLTFDGIKSRNQIIIRLKFATIVDSGLLLYNGRYNDINDFIALEIIDGFIQFSFSLGDKIQTVSIERKEKISDGECEYFFRPIISFIILSFNL